MSFGFIFATQKWQVTVLFALFDVFYVIDEAQVTFINDLEKDRLANAKRLVQLCHRPDLFTCLCDRWLALGDPSNLRAFGFAAAAGVATTVFPLLQSRITRDLH